MILLSLLLLLRSAKLVRSLVSYCRWAVQIVAIFMVGAQGKLEICTCEQVALLNNTAVADD
jgi:hypothetical protein